MTTIAVGPMEPLRAEHRELLPSIRSLKTKAERALDAEAGEVAADLSSALEFLTEHLLIHAMAEDDVLYPAVERVMGAPGATATMSREHREVARLIDDLAAAKQAVAGGLSSGGRREIASILYALHALVSLHFAKEEELYLPVLDAGLSLEDGQRLMEEMEEAAGHHRQAGH